LQVSVIIPCLDEAATVGGVIREVQAALQVCAPDSEIIVVDDGSQDASVHIAGEAGARVIRSGGQARGIGRAWLVGAREAQGHTLVFLDADGEHDPTEIPSLLDGLQNKTALVLGSRTLGGYAQGARGWLHRSVGTPALTFLLNHYLGTCITDCNTGFRCLPREAFLDLQLKAEGFEAASEMIALAALKDLPIVEVAIHQRGPPPGRQPHLRRWRDGWRHLKTIVLHAPDRVLLRPGLALLGLGAALFLPQLLGPFEWGPVRMDIHLMILGVLLLLIGVEMVGSAMICATLSGAGPTDGPGRSSLGLSRHFVLDRVLPWAGLLFLMGLSADLAVVVKSGLSQWQGIMEPRMALAGTAGMGIAVQLVVLSFVHTVIAQRDR